MEGEAGEGDRIGGSGGDVAPSDSSILVGSGLEGSAGGDTIPLDEVEVVAM